MIKGFNDVATEANTRVTGGQTVFNASPMIGGCAIASGTKSDFFIPNGALPGDLLIMTKPLGIQLAANVYQWMKLNNENW